MLDHFYKVESKFKWKLFDCLTGKIICDYLKTGQLVSAANTGGPSASTAMFTESGQGVTVVGPIETLKGYVEKLGLEATVRLFVCMYICMYTVCSYIRVCMYVCMYVCINIIIECENFLSKYLSISVSIMYVCSIFLILVLCIS